MAANRGDAAHGSARAYDRELIPWLFEHWMDPFIDLGCPQPSGHLVDLACGTGLVTRHLSDRLIDGGHLHAVDADRSMLRYARGTGLPRAVRWTQADAAHLPFRSGSVDRVYCHQGLQFFPKPDAVMNELSRVTRSGALMVVAVWGRIEDNPWPRALAHAVSAVLGESAGQSMTVVCHLGAPEDLADAMRNDTFHDLTIEVREANARHSDANAAVAGQIASLPSGTIAGDLTQDLRNAIAGAMIQQLHAFIGPGGELEIPSTAVFARAARH
jgi:ubiquinone/menaquinone biosynthesis C-methylase UbiE